MPHGKVSSARDPRGSLFCLTCHYQSREINSHDLARDAGFSTRAASGACQFCFERPTHPPSHTHTQDTGTGTYRAAAAAATTRSASSARSPGSRVTSSSSSHAGDDDSSDEDDSDGSSDARAMVEPSGQHRMRAHGEQQSRRQQRQHNVSV